MSGGGAGYRLRQFLRALEEGRALPDTGLIETYLDGRGRRLFYALSARDQVHSARTAAALMRYGPADAGLMVAALLHDIGKGQQQLWHRGLYVLLTAISPRLIRSAGRAGAGWRGALFRLEHHPELGAALARSLGHGEDVARLISEHHGTAGNARQVALQWADAVA